MTRSLRQHVPIRTPFKQPMNPYILRKRSRQPTDTIKTPTLSLLRPELRRRLYIVPRLHKVPHRLHLQTLELLLAVASQYPISLTIGTRPYIQPSFHRVITEPFVEEVFSCLPTGVDNSIIWPTCQLSAMQRRRKPSGYPNPRQYGLSQTT